MCSYFQFNMCGFWFEIIFYVFLVSHIVTTETSIERDNVVSENNQRGTLKEIIGFKDSSFYIVVPP